MFHLLFRVLIWEMSRSKAGQLTSLVLSLLPSVWLGNLEWKDQIYDTLFNNVKLQNKYNLLGEKCSE